MRPLLLIAPTLSFLSLLALPLPARADYLALQSTPEGPAARLIEAHRLAALGETARDPVLLLAAARLMQGLALRAAGPADRTDGATVPDPATAAPLPGALDPATLFETARQMAPEDSALREAIADAAAETPPPPQGLALSPHGGDETLSLTLPGTDAVQIGLLTLKGQFAYTLTAPDGTVLCQDASATPGRLCTLTLPESQTLTLTTKGQATWLLLTP